MQLITVNYWFKIIYNNIKIILKSMDDQEKNEMSITITLQNYAYGIQIMVGYDCIKNL